jgi:hypothetical protein
MPQDQRKPSAQGVAPNLASMSREEKLELLEALEERTRRSKLIKSRYKPNSGQVQVHRATEKTRLVISGNGAGKTCFAVHEAVWAAQGYNPITGQYIPVPRRIVVVLDKPDKVADKWLPEVRKWFDTEKWTFNKHGKPYVTDVGLPNGSEIRFMFHEQEPLAFESIELDDCIMDEPPPRKVYIGLIRGMRNRSMEGRVTIIGTPITGSWLRRDIYEPWAKGELPDTMCFRFGTDVNAEHLPEGYVAWFSSKLSEKERRIRLEGEFFDLEGLALAHLFKREVHILEPDYEFDKKFPCVIALDPHPSKAHCALLVGATKEGLVAIKELSAKLPPREYARKLKEWYSGYRIVDIICDSLGSADMTGGEGFLSFIQVLNSEGIRARATTFEDKNDESWVMRVQDNLLVPEIPNNFGQKLPRLRIMPACRQLISDIETVQWTRYKNLDELKPTLDITNKDVLSCLKYALSTNLNANREKASVYYRTAPAYGIEPKHKIAAKRHPARMKWRR